MYGHHPSRKFARDEGTSALIMVAVEQTLAAVPSAVGELTEGHPYPVGMALDDADTAFDVIDLLFLGDFATGGQPFARTARVDRCRTDATLLPAGAQVLRTAVDGKRRSVLAAGTGWTLRAVRYANETAEVTVTAISDELARAVVDEAVREAAEPPPPQAVQIGFWYSSPRRGPVRTLRPITTQPWSQVRANYTAPVAQALDSLMALRPDGINGRLLLLHGPPGTGKTTALRTLAEQWREWCQVDCVLDPETLFSSPAYLLDLTVGPDDDDDDDMTTTTTTTTPLVGGCCCSRTATS